METFHHHFLGLSKHFARLYTSDERISLVFKLLAKTLATKMLDWCNIQRMHNERGFFEQKANSAVMLTSMNE